MWHAWFFVHIRHRWIFFIVSSKSSIIKNGVVLGRKAAIFSLSPVSLFGHLLIEVKTLKNRDNLAPDRWPWKEFLLQFFCISFLFEWSFGFFWLKTNSHFGASFIKWSCSACQCHTYLISFGRRLGWFSWWLSNVIEEVAKGFGLDCVFWRK